MQKFVSKNASLIYCGLSRDERTNVWKVVCPSCGHTTMPNTTMRSTQVFTCGNRKCNKDIFVDYNEEIVKLHELQ